MNPRLNLPANHIEYMQTRPHIENLTHYEVQRIFHGSIHLDPSPSITVKKDRVLREADGGFLQLSLSPYSTIGVGGAPAGASRRRSSFPLLDVESSELSHSCRLSDDVESF